MDALQFLRSQLPVAERLSKEIALAGWGSHRRKNSHLQGRYLPQRRQRPFWPSPTSFPVFVLLVAHLSHGFDYVIGVHDIVAVEGDVRGRHSAFAW